jgi:UDP-N-acetylmuramoylalanine--D-glutamate ligase
MNREAAYWRDHDKSVKIFSASDVTLPGQHNLMNILAAATAALSFGVPPSAIKRVARNFRGLHDRLELVRVVRGVKFYNDTSATSPDAVVAALNTLGRPVVLIAGGSDKKLSYGNLADMIKKQVSALILLPGTATAKLQRSLAGYKKIFLVNDMKSAVVLASRLSPAHGYVLLSPGAASFGLFKHEFDRGEQFRHAVRRLR